MSSVCVYIHTYTHTHTHARTHTHTRILNFKKKKLSGLLIGSFGDIFVLTGEPQRASKIFAFEALARYTSVNPFLGAFAIFPKAILASSCLSVLSSVCPHGTTRLPLDGFSQNLIFIYFSKICLENASFFKTCQE